MFLFSLPAFALNEINIIQTGPYITLARNVAWAGNGLSGFNNAYIFTPSSPDTGICIYVQNLDTSVHTFTLSAIQTGDPSVSSFNNNPGAWNNLPAIGGGSTIRVAAGTVFGSTRILYTQAAGAAKLAILAQGGTAAGNVTLTIVQSKNSCGQDFQYPTYGTISLSQTVSTGTTTKLVSNDNGPFGVHVLGITLSVGGATVTAGTSSLIYGTGATCGTGTQTAFKVAYGTTGVQISAYGGGNELFPQPNQTTPDGDSVCLVDSGSTAGTVVNMTYSFF